MARARSCTGTITATAAAACGVNSAAPNSVAPRIGNRAAKPGLHADTRWPAANHNRASVSRRRRSTPLIAAAISGAPNIITAAPTLISWPATGTETCSACARLFRLAGTAITPQATTKLPNIKAHRLRRCAAPVAAAMVSDSLSRLRG